MAIGTSAYKLVLDSTKFVDGATLSRRELSFLKTTMRETATQTEIYGAAMDKLGDLQRKGALTADQYQRAVAKLNDELAEPTQSPFGPDVGGGGLFAGLTPTIDVVNLASKAMNLFADSARLVRDAVGESIEEIDTLITHSQTLGISASAFQNIAGAADFADMEMSQAANSVEKMLVAISKGADGQKKFAEAFRMIGVDAKSLVSAAPDEAFAKILTSIQGIANQADRVRVATQIFGSPDALRMSASAIGEVSRRLDEMGGHISDLDTARFNQFDDAMKELNQDTASLWRRLSLELVPALTQAVGAADDLTRAFGGSGGALRETGDALTGLIATLREFQTPIGAGSFGGAFQQFADPSGVGRFIFGSFGERGSAQRLSDELDARRKKLNDDRENAARLEFSIDPEMNPDTGAAIGGRSSRIDRMYEEDRAMDAIVEKYRRRREELSLTGRELELHRARMEGLRGEELSLYADALKARDTEIERAKTKEEFLKRELALKRAVRDVDTSTIGVGTREEAALFARSGRPEVKLEVAEVTL